MKNKLETEVEEVLTQITEYLCVGGLFNPEAMEHDKVQKLILRCRDTIESLKSISD